MTECQKSDESTRPSQTVTDNSIKSELSSFQLDTSDAATASYLDSFNIDVGSSEGDQNAPHYIINLNAYNSSCSPVDGLDNLASVPVAAPLPSTSKNPNQSTTQSEHSDPSPPTPLANTEAQLRPMVPSRGRGRGRQSFVPLNDVMEKKIKTFEGRDCAQHLAEFQRMFPRFKRAYINRVFTSNMLDYEKTFKQLNEEHKLEDAKYANVRLIHSSKQEKRNSQPKPRPELAPLSPQSLLYLELPLGKCPPHIANTLYRRVTVNPDGTVESADSRENRFLNVNGMKNRRPVMLLPPPKMAPLKLPVPSGSQPRTPSAPSPRPPPTPQSTPTVSPKVVSNPQPSSPELPVSRPSGNRFFRTNRISDAESKKRDYVDKELRNAKSLGSGAIKRPRSSIQKDLDNSSSDAKEGDAAQYMASVGVVSTPLSRKKLSKPGPSMQSVDVDSQNESHIKADEPIDDGLNLTGEERVNILDFFNEARPEELALMPGCSRKTAEVLSSLRPFQNMNNLMARLSGTRYLSPNMIDSCKEVLQMRSTIIRLLQRCERITERVSARASRLLANNVSLEVNDMSSEEAKPEQLLTQQPAILNPLRELKPYQLVGLNWLRLLHHEQVNGILADEMGLGKTIQAIAFLASLWESGDRGPHLIICPSSTQDNWQRELSDWCSHLKVLVYQGTVEQRKAIRLKIYDSQTPPDFNILLTSYAIGTSTIEDRALMKRTDFHYGIFDEAHMLKNMSSQRFRHLSNFHVRRRLLLTGTPLQNNLLELVSLLSFLMPDMFSRSTDLLKKMFQVYSKPVNQNGEISDQTDGLSKFEQERLVQAKNLLQPFFLRRLKSQVLGQLPTKTSEVVLVPMTESQSSHYWKLVERLRQATRKAGMSNGLKPADSNDVQGTDGSTKLDLTPPNKKPRSDGESINGTDTTEHPTQSKPETESPSNMICQLRKAANHQALLSGIAYSEAALKNIAETLHLDPSHANADPKLILEDLLMLSDHQIHKICQFYDILSSYTLPIEAIMSGSGKLTWLDENIPRLIKEGHRLLIFSQFVIVLDVIEEFLRARDRRYLRLDGSTPVNERQELVDRFNSSSIEVFLLSTRAGGLGLNLTGADTVVIHDIDFNPYNDRQAEDRVHRLGQTKPVHVIRLISKGTVEEGILRIATEKMRLEQDVTGSSLMMTSDEQDFGEDEESSETKEATNGEDELTESNDLVLKIMGSPELPSTVKPQTPNKSSSRSVRLTDNEFWTLLEDALKPVS